MTLSVSQVKLTAKAPATSWWVPTATTSSRRRLIGLYKRPPDRQPRPRRGDVGAGRDAKRAEAASRRGRRAGPAQRRTTVLVRPLEQPHLVRHHRRQRLDGRTEHHRLAERPRRRAGCGLDVPRHSRDYRPGTNRRFRVSGSSASRRDRSESTAIKPLTPVEKQPPRRCRRTGDRYVVVVDLAASAEPGRGGRERASAPRALPAHRRRAGPRVDRRVRRRRPGGRRPQPRASRTWSRRRGALGPRGRHVLQRGDRRPPPTISIAGRSTSVPPIGSAPRHRRRSTLRTVHRKRVVSTASRDVGSSGQGQRPNQAHRSARPLATGGGETHVLLAEGPRGLRRSDERSSIEVEVSRPAAPGRSGTITSTNLPGGDSGRPQTLNGQLALQRITRELVHLDGGADATVGEPEDLALIASRWTQSLQRRPQTILTSLASRLLGGHLRPSVEHIS